MSGFVDLIWEEFQEGFWILVAVAVATLPFLIFYYANKEDYEESSHDKK